MPLFRRKKPSDAESLLKAAITDRLNAAEEALGLDGGKRTDYTIKWSENTYRMPVGDMTEVYQRFGRLINQTVKLVQLKDRVPPERIGPESTEEEIRVFIVENMEALDQELLEILKCAYLWKEAAQQRPSKRLNRPYDFYDDGMLWCMCRMRADFCNSRGWLLTILGQEQHAMEELRIGANYEKTAETLIRLFSDGARDIWWSDRDNVQLGLLNLSEEGWRVVQTEYDSSDEVPF